MVSSRIRERYLRDPLPIRLGGLAADVARIASCAENPKNHEAVNSLLVATFSTFWSVYRKQPHALVASGNERISIDYPHHRDGWTLRAAQGGATAAVSVAPRPSTMASDRSGAVAGAPQATI